MSGDDKVKVSGKILPGSVRVSVMAEGQRPRKTKRKREKATPVNAEIQAAVEKAVSYTHLQQKRSGEPDSVRVESF